MQDIHQGIFYSLIKTALTPGMISVDWTEGMNEGDRETIRKGLSPMEYSGVGLLPSAGLGALSGFLVPKAFKASNLTSGLISGGSALAAPLFTYLLNKNIDPESESVKFNQKIMLEKAKERLAGA